MKYIYQTRMYTQFIIKRFLLKHFQYIYNIQMLTLWMFAEET